MPTRRELYTSLAQHSRIIASLYDELAEEAGAEEENPTDPVDPTPVDPEPVDPTPEPEPEPVPSQPIWDLLSKSTLSVPSSVEVPSGQNDIYIPVSLDHTDIGTVTVTVEGLSNVSGGGINVGDRTNQARYIMQKVYTWSPGDDLIHYIHLRGTSTAYPDGRSLKVYMRERGTRSDNKGTGVTVTFRDGAQHPNMPVQNHRPMRKLKVLESSRSNQFDRANFQHTPNGFKDGTPVWKSRPDHGRIQGNNETGLYVDSSIPRAVNPISYDAAEDAVRLHTHAFPDGQPLEYQNQNFPHQAVMINGQEMDDVCGTEGVWRIVCKTASRRYAWPAFWLIGRGKNDTMTWGKWPPEWDVFEHFNQVYGTDYPMSGKATSYGQHWGPNGDDVGNLNPMVKLDDLGREMETLLWDGYHSFACAVVYDETDTTKSEITFFVDDLEVGCQRLMARDRNLNRKQEMFPMANVAVRAPEGYPADTYNNDGSGDMLIKDIGHWKTGFTMEPVAA